MENVELFPMFDNIDDKDKHDWQNGATFVKNTIGDKIDVVFAGTDYKGKNIWECLITFKLEKKTNRPAL